MSTEREQVMNRDVDSASTTVLRLVLVCIKINVAWHEIFVRPGPVPACGTTSGLSRRWSPKLGSLKDLLRYFLKCFANSDRSLGGRLDKERVHTAGKGLTLRCRHLSGEFLHERQEGGTAGAVSDGPCRPCFQR